MEAFLSHSRKDIEFVNRIYKVCNRARIKPNIAEFEELEAGKLTANDIANMIHRSRYFLLFLTENVINSIHTQNWVAFELGCAYGAKTRPPSMLKDIYVFEPFQQVIFPLPYLDYYILFDPVEEPHWDFIEQTLSEERIYWRKLFPLLWGQRPSDERGIKMYCEECKSEYTLLSRVKEFYCPTCRRYVGVS